MSSWSTPSTIAAITIGAAATGVLGYAIYFDYKRQNDPGFRKELKRSQRRALRIARSQAEQVGQAQKQAIQDAIAEAKEEGFPTSVEEKEAFFMEHVAQGEQLANDGSSEVEAALAFYKALKVYPQPSDLMAIYDKTVPKPVLDILAEMIAADPTIKTSGGSSERGVDD